VIVERLRASALPLVRYTFARFVFATNGRWTLKPDACPHGVLTASDDHKAEVEIWMPQHIQKE
jgi:hypothetical protein